MKTLRDGSGKKTKKKKYRYPNPNFCFGPFLPPSMRMQSIQLEPEKK